MSRTLYNHKSKILGTQTVPNIKAIYPGMIVNFNYTSKNITDKNPMVFVLHKEYVGRRGGNNLIQGINLNYLSSYNVTSLFDKLTKGAGVYSPKDSNIITLEDQASDYDDKFPYRNLLKEPFSRVKIPVYREVREGNPLSKSEAKRQMEILYEKVLKKMVDKKDMYRSYKMKNMKTIRVLRFRF